MGVRYGCWQSPGRPCYLAMGTRTEGLMWPRQFPRTNWRAWERPVGHVGLGPVRKAGTRTRNTPPAASLPGAVGYGTKVKAAPELTGRRSGRQRHRPTRNRLDASHRCLAVTYAHYCKGVPPAFDIGTERS